MNIETLKKLAQNPHYQLSKDQLAMLEAHQIKHVRPIPKHNTKIRKHNPQMEQEK